MTHYQFDHFHFDSERGSLRRVVDTPDSETAELEQSLRHKVANLLCYLIEHRDRVVGKEELLKALWQHGDYRENSLTQSIRELRLALGDSAQNPRFIKTFTQRGYQFIAELSVGAEQTTVENLMNAPASELAVQSQGHSQNQPQNQFQGPSQNQSDKQPEISSSESARLPQQRSYLGLAHPYRRSVLALCLVVFISLAVALVHNLSGLAGAKHTASAELDSVQSLLVLPFINATDDPAMAWLELGLSDMLAIDLQRRQQLTVTSPSQAQSLLLQAELAWPTLPVHVRGLLREHGIDSALYASVRRHGGQQVLDFQIIYRDGRNHQGAVSYPSLPAEAQSITRQLLHLLRPDQQLLTKQPTEDPVAAQALAEGMQALHKSGPLKAQKYFQASLTIESDSHWARAWLAHSQLKLGKWPELERLLEQIPKDQLTSDVTLHAFTGQIMAELAYKRGDSDAHEHGLWALTLAKRSSDTNLQAQAYHLLAQQAWDRLDWQQHQEFLTRAEALVAGTNDLAVKADQLFYLGAPSSEGLERSPLNDLEANRPRLEKALNFYRQLDNQPKIAASLLAIAQNYRFSLGRRSSALKEAIALYRQLQQPFELVEALLYAGFYQMQMHRGDLAEVYFLEAKQLSEQLGSEPMICISDFYLAFATLDQGLDQRSIGGHGHRPDILAKALVQLNDYMDAYPSDFGDANALVFVGWAHSDLARNSTGVERASHYKKALAALTKAHELNRRLNMPATFGYSSYSIMAIHLERGDYHKVTALAEDPIYTRQQASFLARAYYELGQFEQATDALALLKLNSPGLWQPEDELRLDHYRQAAALPTESRTEASTEGRTEVLKMVLPPEPLAHLTYCESDWLIE